jgi:exo-beta-1,3-glucanase (GH17 family)
MVVFGFILGLVLGPSTIGVVDSAAVGLTEKKLYGVNYSMRQGPDWDEFKCQSPDQARAALANLQSVTNNIRIFSVTDCDAAAILLGITQELDMGIWLGLWIAEDGLYFDQERNRLLELLESDGVSFENVLGVHVSSEAIYRKELTAAQAISYRDIIKQDFIDNNFPNIPIVVVDIVDSVIAMPQLIYAEEDVVMFNQFPIWSGKATINTAANYMEDEISIVESLAQGRQIIVGETGWADAGSNENANPATPSSYAKFLRDWICLANERNWQYFWFDAYDSDWRRVQDNLPNDVEGHFGTFVGWNEIMAFYIFSAEA